MFVTLGAISDSMHATVFGSVGWRITHAPWWRTGRWAVPGTMYLGLGLFAAFAGDGADD